MIPITTLKSSTLMRELLRLMRKRTSNHPCPRKRIISRYLRGAMWRIRSWPRYLLRAKPQGTNMKRMRRL